MMRQRRDILVAGAQPHRLDWKHVEAEVKTLAKLALLHDFLEVVVGHGDHAHIHRACSLLANALKVAFLQYAQEFALQLRRNFTHLVEKQRAATREAIRRC